MSENPLVSIVLPVFNAAPYLEESLNSIICQTYKNLEIIVIDDGSTDESQDIIRRYQDNRIRLYIHEDNQGLISTLNEGIERAQGKYIARMDADDVALSRRIEKQVAFLENNPEVGILGTRKQLIGIKQTTVNYPIHDEEIRWELLYRCSISHPTVIIRKELFKDSTLRFDKEYFHAEDYDLWTRLLRITKAANLPEVLLKYRIHDASVSNQYQSLQSHNTLRVVQRNLSWLGTDATLEQAALFRRFADRAFDFSPDEMQLLLPILKGLLASDNLPAYSQRQIKERLWHLMLNATQLSYKFKTLFLHVLQKEGYFMPPAFWRQRLLAYHIRLSLP